MVRDILRLHSVDPWGIGGTASAALSLIYSFLFKQFESQVYSHIFINLIGDDLQELIIKDGKGININIRYPVENFQEKSEKEQNLVRLDIIHTALLRIAEKDKKLDKNKLEKIRDEILQHDLEFDLVYKQFHHKTTELVGTILMHPSVDKFSFYFYTEFKGSVVGKILLYEGKCGTGYIGEIFYSGRWIKDNEFVIKDKNKEFELHIFVHENRMGLVNLTKYKKPPYFEAMKAGGFHEEAYKDWLHSLPPGTAGFLNFGPN